MYDVIEYNKGVELTSTTLMGFIAGIDNLYKEGYDIDYRTVQQRGILFTMYCNKANFKADRIINKQMIENQRIIELEEEVEKLKEIIDELKTPKTSVDSKPKKKSPGRPKKK